MRLFPENMTDAERISIIFYLKDMNDHLEARNEELQVSRQEWVKNAQASEKEGQRLFEENERLTKQLSALQIEYDKLQKAYDASFEMWKERDKEYDALRAECFRLNGLIQTQDSDKE